MVGVHEHGIAMCTVEGQDAAEHLTGQVLVLAYQRPARYMLSIATNIHTGCDSSGGS
jgi:ATP-dependent Clp protease adapter protein ClpS